MLLRVNQDGTDRELVVSILAWREQHVLGGNEFI